MACEDIEQAQWPGFCQTFARRHRGWRVNVHELDTAGLPADATEVIPAEGPVAQDMALRDVVWEAGDDGADSLTLQLDGHGGPPAYGVESPGRICLERRPDGADQGLRIDTEAGRTVLMRFRAAAQPEALDGLADIERAAEETGC
jgi:hypothetical protein